MRLSALRLCHKATIKRFLRDAEKIVGNANTSYSNLQGLLNSDVANVALSVRKLIGTRHPLLKVVKYFLNNGQNLIQTLGVVVLLVSKLVNTMSRVDEVRHCKEGVLPSQRSVAEIAELIYAANLMHKSVLSTEEMSPAGDRLLLTLGNKMSVLSGDYLLANACVALAKLRQPSFVKYISRAIADMSLAEYYAADGQNVADRSGVRATTRHFVDPVMWERAVYLGIGSLLTNSCLCCCQTAALDDALKNAVKNFARNLIAAHMLKMATRYSSSSSSSQHAVDETFIATVDVPVISANRAVTEDMQTRYHGEATTSLAHFKDCDARSALKTFVDSVALL